MTSTMVAFHVYILVHFWQAYIVTTDIDSKNLQSFIYTISRSLWKFGMFNNNVWKVHFKLHRPNCLLSHNIHFGKLGYASLFRSSDPLWSGTKFTQWKNLSFHSIALYLQTLHIKKFLVIGDMNSLNERTGLEHGSYHFTREVRTLGIWMLTFLK